MESKTASSWTRVRFGLFGGILAVWIFYAACSSDPDAASTVTLDPASATMVSLGETLTLTATARTSEGQEVAGASFTWSSSNDAVATVEQSGLVTAAANGTVTVTATTGGVNGTASVEVAQVATRVDVSPPSATITAYGTDGAVQLTASAFDAGDSPIPSAMFSWTSSDDQVALVGLTGAVTTTGAGTATITATRDGASAGSAITSNPPTVPTANLQAHYPFTGNAADASGNGRDGTVTGATLQPDRFENTDGAYRFGIDAFVDLGSVFDGVSTPFTISVWAFRTTPSAAHPIIVSDDHQTDQIGFWLELNVSEFLTVGYADGVDASAGRRTKTSAAGVPLTRWSHLAATVRGPTDMTLYINGVEVTGNYEGSGGTIVHDAGAPARIGLRTLSAPSFWEGLLDDIRIYDRSLSDTEIMQLFDEGGLNN